MQPFQPSTSQPTLRADSITADDDGGATSPPLRPLASRRLPAAPSRSSLSSSPALLLTPLPSLAGLSWSHEEARLARMANKRRGRLTSPPLSRSNSGGDQSHSLPLPASSAQSLARSERLLEDSYSRLSFSPPSPTPSLMDGGSALFARPAHQRRLWPPHSQQQRDDEDDDVVGGGSADRAAPVASAASRSSDAGSGGSGIGGRPVSDRQRQQMQYTESLSPSPLEEPHEETDNHLASAQPSGGDSSAGVPTDSNPLSAAILYVYSLVTTSPADVAGLRPRDFIIAIDRFNKQGWQPDMIEVLHSYQQDTLDPHSPATAVSATVLTDIVSCHGRIGEDQLRVVVLRRIPLDDAAGRPDITWARTKKNGNGNGHNISGTAHTATTVPAAARSSGHGGNGDGNGSECLIALQQLELWSSIGRWRIEEQQGAEGGGVLGAVLCCYPDPQPVSSPPPVPQPIPPPDLSCSRHYPALQRGGGPSSTTAPSSAGRGGSTRATVSSAAAPAPGSASFTRFH